MPKALLIVGLPGSGKTYLGKQLEEQADFILLDDYKDKELTQISSLRNGTHSIVITHPDFCKDSSRQVATRILSGYGYEVEFIFYENDLEACKANVERRNDGRQVLSLQKLYSQYYKIPANAVTLEVYKDEN